MLAEQAKPPASMDLDHRGRDWYADKAIAFLVFVGGISAIIFIIGIFVFITKEGVGFISGPLDVREFLGVRPGDQRHCESQPTECSRL